MSVLAAQYQGGSQLPFLQTQSAAGLIVVHVPLDVPPLVSPGSQLPFTHTKFAAGFGVVQEDAGAIQGGSQLPLTQTQLAAGLMVVQVPVVLPPPVSVGASCRSRR